jgi:D-alanine-D-alanine ligase
MRTIAIVAGGNSSEYEISVKSANEVNKILSSRYITYIIMLRGINWYWEDPKGRFHAIDKNDFSLITDDARIRFDAVFIAIHGTPGEDGLLQGYLDMLEIPYTSCSSFCSALTFNKQACKSYLREYGIPLADSFLINRREVPATSEIIRRTGLPCFVKPNASGSSFGVSKVTKEEELSPAIEKAFHESPQVMVEAFMEGREVGCGVVKSMGKTLVLPVTEIISKNDFFDYEAKYTPGRSDEITPADLPAEITDEIQEMSSAVYDILGCNGIVRVDFIIVGTRPFFLEINSVPGMTPESIVPKQAEAAAVPLEELYSMVVEDSVRKSVERKA